MAIHRRRLPERKPVAVPPPGSGSSSLLRTKKLGLRDHMGLLKDKQAGEDFDDVEKKLLEHELAIAGELQANLLPRRLPQLPGFDIRAYYKPSREVGGDYYDFIEIDADHLGILVADVSGKGIPASIVMTETRALMKSEAVRTLSAAEALMRVNRTLHQDIKRGMFVTMFYTILSIHRRVLTVTSCGHNPMVIWRQATNTCHLVNPNGLALGIDKGPFFDKTIKEQRIQLNEGDRFLLYTDGVVEAMNAAGEQYGSNRLYLRTKQLARSAPTDFLTGLVTDVEAHEGDAPQHDDITIVSGQILASAPDPEETHISE